MNYTKEQIEQMADKYANQFMDGKDHYYGFIAGFEKALSLFAINGTLPIAQNLLRSIKAARPEEDVVINDLYNQCRKLVKMLCGDDC